MEPSRLKGWRQSGGDKFREEQLCGVENTRLRPPRRTLAHARLLWMVCLRPREVEPGTFLPVRKSQGIKTDLIPPLMLSHLMCGRVRSKVIPDRKSNER